MFSKVPQSVSGMNDEFTESKTVKEAGVWEREKRKRFQSQDNRLPLDCEVL